jgi:lysozyme
MIDRLKGMLIRHEGLRQRPYKCPAGYNTIGVGHNFDANPLPEDISKCLQQRNKITMEMVDRLLEEDIEIALKACRRLYPGFDNFTENMQIALADFCFNVGEGTARTFKNTNRAINEERWEDAARGFENSKWYSQVGNRAKEIVAMIRGG